MDRINDQSHFKLLDGSYGEKLILDWDHGEPNNSNDKENCAHVIATSSQLNDVDCSRTSSHNGNKNIKAVFHGLCEKKYV